MEEGSSVNGQENKIKKRNKKGNKINFIFCSGDIASLKYFGYRGRKGPSETFFYIIFYYFFCSVPVSRDKMERIKAQC